MADPYEDQLDAALRELDYKRRELAAARDANGRLTSAMVSAQLRAWRLGRDIERLEQELEQFEALVDSYADSQQQLLAALREANRLTDTYEQRVTQLKAGGSA